MDEFLKKSLQYVYLLLPTGGSVFKTISLLKYPKPYETHIFVLKGNRLYIIRSRLILSFLKVSGLNTLFSGN